MTPDFSKGWIASDLDGTLFSRDAKAVDAIPGSWNSGQAASWMPAATHKLMTALGRSFPIVPVTARSLSSYHRVSIAGLNFAGAVLANGAILQAPDGALDLDWAAEMEARLAGWQPVFHSLMETLAADGVQPRLVTSTDDCTAYIVVKAAPGWWETELGMAQLASLPDVGLHWSVMGVELQGLPPCVSKAQGTRAFMQRYTGGEPPLLALGDMLPDLEFMGIAPMQVAPTTSEIVKKWNS